MKLYSPEYWTTYRERSISSAREWAHLVIRGIEDGATISRIRQRAANAASYAIKALTIRV